MQNTKPIPVMDPRLLAAYNQELRYFNELVGEFAHAHPKVARRLGMQAGEIGDPYVARLVQSASLVTARQQLKLDAAFPEFTGPLLETVYPNYVSPTPSMAVARLFPNDDEGNLREGFRVPRGTEFVSRVPDGERTACTFRSGLDVTLYPLEIVAAKLTGVPPDIPSLSRHVPAGRQVRGALRITLRTTGEARFDDLRGLDRLPVYLSGDECVASRLFKLIHAGALASITGAPGCFGDVGRPFGVVSDRAVEYEGLSAGDSLLPLDWPGFHGHTLLHEFAACPARFWFFALTGLGAGLRRVSGTEAEIDVLLDRSDSTLAQHVDPSRFALFCTPVVNLFRRKAQPVEIAPTGGEIALHPDTQHRSDYEVFGVHALQGFIDKGVAPLEFRPLYRALADDEANHGRYFTVRRERRITDGSSRRYGSRATYLGTDVLVSLVDQSGGPYGEPMKYVSMDAWLTNRELPNLLVADGVTDLTIHLSAPVHSTGLIRAPSRAREPLAQGDVAWRLIGQLSPGYKVLEAQDGSALRNVLSLFAPDDDIRFRRQIDSLTNVAVRPVTQRLPGNGPLRFGRGIECTFTVDEAGWEGMSPYLFGMILEHYLGRLASTHSFIRSVLRSTQRGELMRWPLRQGTRSAT